MLKESNIYIDMHTFLCYYEKEKSISGEYNEYHE